MRLVTGENLSVISRTLLARHLRGWTQRDLSDATAITVARLSYIEHQHDLPGENERNQLSRVLDMPPAWFEGPPIEKVEPICPRWRKRDKPCPSCAGTGVMS